MKLLRMLLATAMILTLGFSAAADLPVKKVLTLKAAKAIAGAAEDLLALWQTDEVAPLRA